jgi:hypothetical protein
MVAIYILCIHIYNIIYVYSYIYIEDQCDKSSWYVHGFSFVTFVCRTFTDFPCRCGSKFKTPRRCLGFTRKIQNSTEPPEKMVIPYICIYSYD